MGGGQSSQKASPLNDRAEFISKFNSYEEACKSEPKLQAFDQTLHQHTSQVINNPAIGVEARTLPLDSLLEVPTSLLQMNQEVVKVILECKEDIWNDQDLVSLVKDYFDNSLQMLDFCNALQKCLKRANDSQLILQFAIWQFEQEELGGTQETKYIKTLEELRNFKAAGDPFTEEFFTTFQSVYEQQNAMLARLDARVGKLSRKLKSAKGWKIATKVIFTVASVSVLIVSVFFAPVLVPLQVILRSLIPQCHEWSGSLLKNYQETLKGQRELVDSMHKGTYMTLIEMDNISALVKMLVTEIESATNMVDFAMRNEKKMKFTMGEIKKQLMVFTETVDKLGKSNNQSSREILRARTVVMQRIVKSSNP